MSRIKPARLRQLVFGFYMSGMMSLLMSGVITFINTGMDSEFIYRWMPAFFVACRRIPAGNLHSPHGSETH